jgi:hypothetical protein
MGRNVRADRDQIEPEEFKEYRDVETCLYVSGEEPPKEADD